MRISERPEAKRLGGVLARLGIRAAGVLVQLLAMLLLIVPPCIAADVQARLGAQSLDHQGYKYDAYRFTPAGKQFRVFVRSKEMDAYLMLVAPDGQILT